MGGTVHDAIAAAEALLPGEPAPDDELDPRWQAIIEVGQFITTEPEAVWEFTARWGGHEQDDLRSAIATCLLEHLLEHHFDRFFPRVEKRVKEDVLFRDMFPSIWTFGLTKEPSNFARYDALRRWCSDQD